MNFRLICWFKGFVSLFLLLHSSFLLAHAPGLSAVDLSILTNQIDVKVTFPVQDIEAFAPMDTDLDAEVSDLERNAAKPAIAKLITEQIRFNIDNQDLQPTSLGLVNFDNQGNVQINFEYSVNPKEQIVLVSKFLSSLLPEGHQQYVTVRNQNNQIIAEKMLTKQDFKITILLANPVNNKQINHTVLIAFVEFLKLGMEHILTGYDHLLFLFALLAVTHSFWPALKIITFFTIAHSITLACASLNIIDLPSRFVEPFIAATIVYVGLENVFRGDHPKGRHWLTFGFGLIHGFGFASVLKEMEISSGDSGILLPLLSFNLGIEIGQIAVASCVLPLIWQLNNKPLIAGKFLKVCSLLVSLMGCYWFLERTLL